MRIFIVTGLSLFLFTKSFSQSNSDIETIKKINIEWLNSVVRKDTASLNKIFSDDLIIINGQGASLNKQQVLSIIMEPTRKYKSAKIDSVIKESADEHTGFLVLKITMVRVLNNDTIELKINVLNIFKKTKSRWLVIASHSIIMSSKEL